MVGRLVLDCDDGDDDEGVKEIEKTSTPFLYVLEFRHSADEELDVLRIEAVESHNPGFHDDWHRFKERSTSTFAGGPSIEREAMG